jgi:hypothetical protein
VRSLIGFDHFMVPIISCKIIPASAGMKTHFLNYIPTPMIGSPSRFVSRITHVYVTMCVFTIFTVKRPKFDIHFGENIFFLQNLFR